MFKLPITKTCKLHYDPVGLVSPESRQQRHANQDAGKADEAARNNRYGVRRNGRHPARSRIAKQRSTEVADHFDSGEAAAKLAGNRFIPDRPAK